MRNLTRGKYHLCRCDKRDSESSDIENNPRGKQCHSLDWRHKDANLIVRERAAVTIFLSVVNVSSQVAGTSAFNTVLILLSVVFSFSVVMTEKGREKREKEG